MTELVHGVVSCNPELAYSLLFHLVLHKSIGPNGIFPMVLGVADVSTRPPHYFSAVLGIWIGPS